MIGRLAKPKNVYGSAQRRHFVHRHRQCRYAHQIAHPWKGWPQGHTGRDLRHGTAACETISFAVAILGHSLNPHEKMRVADIVRTHCNSAKILELHTGMASELPDADEHLQVNVIEPQAFVDAVNSLMP
jgi:hypothetical protein